MPGSSSEPNYIYIYIYMGWGRSGLNYWRSQGDCARVILILSECIWNVPRSRLSSQPLMIPASWVLFRVMWSILPFKWFPPDWLPPVSLRGIQRLSFLFTPNFLWFPVFPYIFTTSLLRYTLLRYLFPPHPKTSALLRVWNNCFLIALRKPM